MRTPSGMVVSRVPSPSPGRMRPGARYDRLTEPGRLHLSPGSDAITKDPLMTENFLYPSCVFDRVFFAPKNHLTGYFLQTKSADGTVGLPSRPRAALVLQSPVRGSLLGNPR